MQMRDQIHSYEEWTSELIGRIKWLTNNFLYQIEKRSYHVESPYNFIERLRTYVATEDKRTKWPDTYEIFQVVGQVELEYQRFKMELVPKILKEEWTRRQKGFRDSFQKEERELIGEGHYSEIESGSLLKWTTPDRFTPPLRGLWTQNNLTEQEKSFLQHIEVASSKFHASEKIAPPKEALKDTVAYLHNIEGMVTDELASVEELSAKSLTMCLFKIESKTIGILKGLGAETFYSCYKIAPDDELILSFGDNHEMVVRIKSIESLEQGSLEIHLRGYFRDFEQSELNVSVRLAVPKQDLVFVRNSCKWLYYALVENSFHAVRTSSILAAALFGRTVGGIDLMLLVPLEKWSAVLKTDVLGFYDTMQMNCMIGCLTKPFYAVMGPPGTGTIIPNCVTLKGKHR